MRYLKPNMIKFFVGWYLSLDRENTFLKKFQFRTEDKPNKDWVTQWDFSKRFGDPVNKKTVGVTVVSSL